MRYRQFGKLDWKSSVLGFGVMRLPLLDNDPTHVNEEEAIKMLHYAMDNGVNYIDTGYFYHGGKSEQIAGKSLKGSYKEKAKVAVKMPIMIVQSASDFDRLFNEQLKRLDMPKMDFYMLHGLGGTSWQKLRELGIINWAEKKMAQGYFDYFGFSCHDEYAAFKGIIDSYDNWTFAQVQYNYMDVHRQAGIRGVKYANSEKSWRRDHGTDPRRGLGQRTTGIGRKGLGNGTPQNELSRMGITMDLEPAGNLGGFEWDVNDGASSGKHCQCQSFRSREIR